MAAAPKIQKPFERQNAVIYTRYSSNNQSEQSIEGQLRECRAFAERQGYIVIHEYNDRALTGRTDERGEFQKMISDSAKGLFQVVIVWKLDRFARNRYDSANYKRILKKNGVKVVSATEKISDDPEGIILEGVIETVSEYFSANLRQNVMRGQRENMAKGLHVGGYAPYGYKVVDKKLVVIEEEAAIIRYAFEEYAKGMQKKQLRIELAKRGLTSKKGTPIADSTLHNIFSNQKYIGVYLFGEGEVVGGCKPIIDKEIFDKVQEIKAAKAHGKSGDKARQEYLLSGKLFCGLCGEKMNGNFNKNKQGIEYAYYQCMGRKFKKICLKKSEKKDFLEWYVVEQTIEYVLQPGRMEYIAGRIVAKYNEEFNDKELKALEAQLSKIEREANAAVDASIKAPEEARQIYYDKLTLLMAQKADIEHELSVMRIATRHRWTEEQIIKWLQSFSKGEQLEKDFQRRIIDVFISSVYVYDDKIVIYYNIKDGKQVSHIDMIDSLEESEEDIPPENTGGGGGSGRMDSIRSPFLNLFQNSTEYAAVCSSFSKRWNSSR